MNELREVYWRGTDLTAKQCVVLYSECLCLGI